MTAAAGSYRLQLTRNFTLYDAAKTVPYLRDLGVSHIYLSPLMQARPGSNHGYDVTDMNTLSAERGGEGGFRALVAALGGDMRLILDIVPNHMAADTHNEYWRDVLKNGPQSRYWHWFDLFPAADGKIVLPVLPDAAETLWAGGALSLRRKGGEWELAYDNASFPLRNGTVPSADYAAVMAEQYYRLVKWDDDSHTYRRFFHLKELLGLRVEDPEVLQQTHAALFRLLAETKAVTGLRVDHIDGLAAPEKYLQRLREHARGCDVWVEKILSREESLRPWPVAGTTGYEFIDAVNDLFIHRSGFRHIETWWQREIEPAWQSFEACLHEAKEEVVQELFPSAMRGLAHRFAGEAQAETALHFLCRLIVHLPVYRVYDYAWKDRQILLHAVRLAADKDMPLRKEYKKKLRRLLSGDHKKAYRAWQQVSGGIMAKGLEDRAHYRYTPLAALNEVGCLPRLSPNGRSYFCERVNRRSITQPQGMNATSTHDTKRSEDVRARLYALADMPLAWQKLHRQFCALSRQYDIPPSAGYFFLQAVVGTWPLTRELSRDYCARLQDYMEKSACEEARHTGYADLESAYKRELRRFVADMLHQPLFIRHVRDFMRRMAPCGALNALSVLTLKCLSPGWPDIYQGCEMWDFSLVDPDNRRSVDYAQRAQLLRALAEKASRPAFLRLLCRGWKRSWVKLWLTHKLLHIRKRYMADGEASMQTVEIDGPFARHFHAYILYSGIYVFLIVHPLHPGRWGDLQEGLSLPPHICEGLSLRLPPYLIRKQGLDLISGEKVHAGALSAQLARFPIAISLFTAAGTFKERSCWF